MSEEVAKIPKPVMRGLLHAQIKRNLILSFIGSAVGGCLFYFGYVDRRRKAYADFYANYDINKEFHRIRRLGLFDSCDPYEEEEEEEKEGKKE